MQKPLQNPHLVLYTDGPASRPSHNIHLAGYAVVNDLEVLEANPPPAGTSAQVAEVCALIRACTLAKDKSVNIYTDSRYAFGAAHKFAQR